MNSMRGLIGLGLGLLVLAGCVTTNEAAKTERVSAGGEAQIPEILKSCGGAAASQVFEVCGIGPEGDKTKTAPQKIYTQICGPVDLTDELRSFFCRHAEQMFSAINPPKSSAVVEANFPDKTRAYYSREFGNQIDYLAADGRAYFWLSNQKNILAGEWMIYRNAQLCLSVPGLTEHAGTKWLCSPIRDERLVELTEGDVLHLAKYAGHAAPWVLQAQPRLTLAEISQRITTMPARKPSAEPPSPKAPSKPSLPAPADPLAPMVSIDDKIESADILEPYKDLRD